MERGELDPYRTLGVTREATPAEIARSYRRLAKELHPDLRGEGLTPRMRELNLAWEILSDPSKRAAWDLGQVVQAAGTHWSRTPSGGMRRAPRAAGVPPATAARWAAWPAEGRAPRTAARTGQRTAQPAEREGLYPPRPKGERRWTDSPWLIAAIGPATIAGLLVVAGIASSLAGPKALSDSFEGFQTQGRFPELNLAVAGPAIDVRFGMNGFQGTDLLAAGSPVSRYFPCENGETAAPDVQRSVAAASSSFAYEPITHTYVYTWKTDPSWADSCRELTFTFRDGSSRSVLFDFRR